MALIFDPENRYDCVGCGACCSGPWAIHATDAEKASIEALPWDEIDDPVEPSFKRLRAGTWQLGKQPDPTRCEFLDAEQRCAIHKHWGAEAKPAMCRRFPFQHVGSDEHVWITANYGCPGVHGGQGSPLQAHRAEVEACFAEQLDEMRDGARVRYPLTSELNLPDDEIEQAFQGVAERMGSDLFAAMRQLAAFAQAAPQLGEAEPQRRPQQVDEIPTSLRYAFAFTLYADVLDPTRFWERARGVLALPKMLVFSHRYQSRMLDIPIDMAQMLKHPGEIPEPSQALLCQLLRTRLQARQVFWRVPTAAAGITRALLEMDAVLFFARALAPERPIEHEDVLRALNAVEFRITHQGTTLTLARSDARLRRAWRDPAVARAAAQLFAPAS